MSGLPTVTMAGTLTADPELRWTQNGRAVVNFTAAANERRYNKDSGQWEQASATFVKCSCWNKLAENIAESLSKGNRVVLTGELKQRSYQTKNGEDRTVLELAVSEVGVSLLFDPAKPAKRADPLEPADDDPPF